MRGTVWGELARVPMQRGSSRFVHSLTQTILHVAGLGAAAGALLIVVAPAAVAVVIALRSLPWPQIRAEQPLAGRRSFGALAAGFAGAYLVAAADVSAAAGYPYGNRTAGRAIEIANIETTLSPSIATILRGGHANFTVAVQSHETTTATGIVLTIKLTPGLRLTDRPRTRSATAAAAPSRSSASSATCPPST